jgi:hypothetical protein
MNLLVYTSPDGLRRTMQDFIAHYNHRRYHEAIGNDPLCRSQLTDRARNAGEDRVGIGTYQTNRPNHNQQNHSHHYGIFGDILPFFLEPSLAKETDHKNLTSDSRINESLETC